jgi:hypothetical protein
MVRVERDGSPTRPKFAKDHVRIDETPRPDVFVRVFQGAVERSSIFLSEPSK